MKTIQFTPVALFFLLLVALPVGAVGAAAPPSSPSTPGESPPIEAVGGPVAQSGTPGGEAENATNISRVRYGGSGLVRQNVTADRAYVWESEPHTVNVTYTVAEPDRGEHQVCLRLDKTGNSTSSESECKVAPSTAGRYTVTFERSNWTAGPSGEYDARATLNSGGERIAERNVTVYVLTKDGDFDDDGLPNEKELNHSTGFNRTDTDSDGLEDGAEVQDYGTEPTKKDTDDDGLNDGAELNAGTDPTDPDSDGDGLNDGYEFNHEPNPTNSDSDGDGLDDGREVRQSPETDPMEADSDEDGIDDAEEVAWGMNPMKVDTDGDLLSDSTERWLGTDAASALSPFGWVLALLALGAVAAAWAIRHERIDVPYVEDARVRISAARSASAVTAERTDGDGAAPSSRPLTDSERVRNIVEAHGGQVRQSEIVDETGWSKAKVSRVLSRMEDDGEISKIRIGRENLICLPGHEPPSMQQ